MERMIQISEPDLGEEEFQSLREVIFSGWVTQGPKVNEFEKAFAREHNVKHALAVTSCTTGLHLALEALGIGEGDEVILPAFSWIATANVVEYTGAKPIFADIDLATFNIDPYAVNDLITDKTKAIIPVHLFGLAADMDALKEILPDHVKVIEDAACASGAKYKDQYVGGLGDVASFSFHPRKSITTGEGGMVTTNDDDLAERMNKLRNHGAEISEEQRHKGPKPYLLPEFKLLGFNYRMTDIQGALGLVQLKKLRKYIETRNEWARFYNEELEGVDWLKTPKVDEKYSHGWQAYVCYVEPELAPKERNSIMDLLKDAGISTRPGTHAIHMLEYYGGKYKIQPHDFPRACLANDQSLAIPLHNRMKQSDYEYIVKTIKAI